MRVIGGTARGRKLKEPNGDSIRPTSDMVKESVFNIVQFDIEGRSVLDLYSGTGQLGIEALSRGARSCIFVDKDPAAVRLIWENIKLCGFTDRANVYMRDAVSHLRSSGKFDLIFIDAPYSSDLAGRTLQKIFEIDKLNENGIIICETRIDTVMPQAMPPYVMQKAYTYGKVQILRYTKIRDDV